MRMYVHLPLLILLLLLTLLPLSMSQLTEAQKTNMTRVSESLKNSSSTWNTTDPDPCKWSGVTCTQNAITHLSLSSLQFNISSFLPLLCNIDTLRSLDLSNNHLSSIPSVFFTNCSGLDSLQTLNFSNNRLSGFPAFVGFSSLELLDLSTNSLDGNITSQFDELVSLRSLNLSGNSLSGPLPTLLGKGMALEELQLSKNMFMGRIPDEILGYGNLTLLDLSSNGLSGRVPDRIGELSKLETLILSSNSLSGGIPQRLSRIGTLSRFAANQNSFSGSIPAGISNYTRNLDLSYNQLSGFIPSNFLSPLNLVFVDLSNNRLEGPIPVDMSLNLFRLRLGGNKLNGSIPSSIGKLSRLMYFEVDGNSLSGEIPPDLAKCEKLTLLSLSQNQFHGSLPKGLGNLSELVVLKLDRNQLSGEIPTEFSQLKNLSSMSLSANSLTGVIPSGITRLLKLSNLNLEHNRLNGSIPDGFVNLTSLLEVQLGNNLLAGSIPGMPSSLQIALNISSNLFEGPIPFSLAELANLEILDLSNNQFSGPIPDFFFRLGSLTQLDLSNNQLSGTIPQFRSGVNVTTTGNKDLVPSTNHSTVPISSTGKRKSLAVLVIVMAVVGAVVAIAVVAVVFIVSRRFYQVDDKIQELEEPVPQVMDGHLITADNTHCSSIDFTKAIEAAGSPANIIFKSRFSTYYKVIMPSGMSYCIKKLNWNDNIFQLGSHEQLIQELKALGRLNNSRIMTPLAYVLTADWMYLFYEHAHKGTVFNFLHKNLSGALDWQSRYNIALRVAQGLSFLHGCQDLVLLLNLSTKTIVLKLQNEPQIADIELFKLINPSKSTGACSAGYIPQEYAYTMRVTMAGNVYSFGVVLLELVTGKPSVSEGTELATLVQSNSAPNDAWEQILDSTISKTSLAVQSQMLCVLKIAQACVSISPESRPKMENVVTMLLNAQ